MTLLTVEGLTVALPPGGDRPHAVEDISLSVNPGEIVCVVGEIRVGEIDHRQCRDGSATEGPSRAGRAHRVRGKGVARPWPGGDAAAAW
jgi:ABC-type phosphonate transport system ATPase subunit